MANSFRKTPARPSLSTPDIRASYPEFTRLLIKRKNELLDRTESARANLDEQVMTSPGDDADVSVLDTSADYFLKLANTHQEELIQIRDAFDRMHRGVYGICATCEEPIAFERLKRLPYARLCVDCQAASERGTSTAHLQRKPTL